MSKKNKLFTGKIKFISVYFAVFLLVSTAEIFGQVVPVRPASVPQPKEDFTWWYATLFILVLGLIGMVFWWMNNKKTKTADASAKSKETNKSRENSNDGNDFDADKELEWLRKNQKIVGKKTTSRPPGKRPSKLQQTASVPETAEAKLEEAGLNHNSNSNTAAKISEKAAVDLPIFSVKRLEPARPFAELPISNDESLMNAIEQMHDEFEEDEEIRDLTLRVLAAFRTKNSVEALSQAALYDLSSSLRSKAVTILSDFDHEAVFETILLANADPTREVRAAAARGLSKLTLDRANAWARITEVGDEGRVLQSAKAAVESGFVDMSFDRLVHPERKYAYEAFALMALLIKAGETKRIFGALENNKNLNVRKAILHTIKITRDQNALNELYLMFEQNTLPIELQEEADKTIEEVGFVTA